MARAFSLYCNRLATIPVEVLQEVALSVIDTAVYFPRVAELMQPALARMRQNQAQVSDERLLEYQVKAVPHAEGVRRLREILKPLVDKFSMQRDGADSN